MIAMRILIGSIVSLSVVAGASGRTYRVGIHNGVAVEMRDGVKLIADVYRPETEGKFPVLLERTPYNRAGGADSAARMAAHGYVVVIQDTRGRLIRRANSTPFRYESQDGYDTVEWAAGRRMPTGRWACSAALTWARHRCWRPLRYRPTWWLFSRM